MQHYLTELHKADGRRILSEAKKVNEPIANKTVKEPRAPIARQPVNNDPTELGQYDYPDGEPVKQYAAKGAEATNLPEMSYKTMEMFMNNAYNTKQALLIYGDPGLGKSDVTRSFAKRVNHRKYQGQREFVNWSKLNNASKKDVITNPQKYFVLIDVRTAQLEPSDLVGIPNIQGKEGYLETLQPKWIYLMSQEGSDGILFLDELNQGSEQVLKALYEVVLDRAAAGTKLSEDFGIFAAGNLGSEFGNQPIPQALTNRFMAGVLIANPEDWLQYALQNGVDQNIIAFVESDPADNFYTKPKDPSDPFSTPRQMVALSNQMKHIISEYAAAKKAGTPLTTSIYSVIGNIAAGLCGVAWARKFVTFLKHIQAFNWADIVKKASTIETFPKDKKLALFLYIKKNILSYLLRHDVDDKESIDKMNGFLTILNNLETNNALILLKYIQHAGAEADMALRKFLAYAIGTDNKLDKQQRDKFILDKTKWPRIREILNSVEVRGS
jgi:GTPase SAR1 family protein